MKFKSITISSSSAFISSILCVMVLLLCLPIFAQNAPNSFASVNHITAENGLPSNRVYCLLEDQDGFMWFGTDAGLCRYNGYEIDVFGTLDGLSDNDVLELKLNEDGRIFIHTFKNLCYYKDEAFTEIPNTAGAFSITELENGNYAADNNQQSLSIYDKDFQLIDSKQSVGGSTFKAVFIESQIFLFQESSVYYGTDVDQLDSVSFDYHIMFSDHIRYAHGDGKLFFIAKEGIVSLDLKTKECKLVFDQFLDANGLSFLDGQVWLTTYNQGVLELDFLPSGKLKLKNQYLTEFPTSRVFKDSKGNLWITTLNDGLFMIPSSAVKTKKENIDFCLDGITIESLLYDEDGGLYIGTQNGEVFHKQGAQVEKIIDIKEFIPNNYNRILSLNQDKKRNLFVGCDRVLGIYDPKEYGFSIINGFAIKSIFIEDDSLLYYTNSAGSQYLVIDDVLEWHSKVYKFQGLEGLINGYQFRKTFSIGDKRAYGISVFEDAVYTSEAKGLVAYTKSDSLNSFDQEFLIEQFPLFGVTIQKIIPDEKGNLWLGTLGNGLIKFDGEEILAHYTQEEGLLSNIIHDFVLEGEELIIATNLGVNLVKLSEGSLKSPLIKSYSKSTGLISNEVKCVAKFGEKIAIGTTNGVMIFEETDMVNTSSKPNIKITKIGVNGENKNLKDRLEIDKNDANLFVEYVGISFESNTNITYHYRLLGVSDEWESTKTRTAYFDNLEKGEYIFEVYCSNYAGEDSKTQSLAFSVKPAFYTSAWFKGILLLLGIISLFLFYFNAQQNRQNKRLKELVSEKTEALNNKIKEQESTNKNLSQANEGLREFAHITSHDLKEPLRTINSFIQLVKIKNEGRLEPDSLKYIDLIESGAVRMENKINDILMLSQIDQRKNETEEVDLNYILKNVVQDLNSLIEENTATIKIAQLPNIRINPINAFQLFQNLITNAIKYRSETPPIIEIGVIEEKDHFQFFVMDNGIGIPKEFKDKIFKMFQRLHQNNDVSGTGIGLALCKKVVESAQGEISFTSQMGQGTTFYFTIPK